MDHVVPLWPVIFLASLSPSAGPAAEPEPTATAPAASVLPGTLRETVEERLIGDGPGRSRITRTYRGADPRKWRAEADRDADGIFETRFEAIYLERTMV